MSRKLSCWLLFMCLFTIPFTSYSSEGQSKTDGTLTQAIASVLKDAGSLRTGMKRKDIFNLFVEEGGLSDRLHRTYVYVTCPYIKVDFEFKPVGKEKDLLHERPDDVISKMSKPYLDWSVSD